MRIRLAPTLTITAALILISSLAYAAKKKDQAKPVPHIPEICEEEALTAELLQAGEENQKKLQHTGDKKKKADEVVKGQMMVKQPKKSGKSIYEEP